MYKRDKMEGRPPGKVTNKRLFHTIKYLLTHIWISFVFFAKEVLEQRVFIYLAYLKYCE